MAQFLSGRKSILNVGVTSSTENKTVLQITGKVGIGTTDAIQNLHVEGSTYISGNLGIGITNPTSKLSVSGDATAFSFFGDFIGGISSITQLQVTGISTFINGPVLIGAATSTGTASQRLQLTGSAYIGGNLGIGITNPTKQLNLSDDIGIGRSIYDSVGDSGANEYVLTSSSTGIIWRAVTGIGAITGINITQNNSDSVNYIPFVNVSSATTATAYVSSTQLTYNPSTNNLGIGTTNATSKLTVRGDGKFSGVVTATTFIGNLDGYASSAGVSTSVIGGIGSLTQLQVTGISTFANGPVLIGGSVGIGTTNLTSKLTVVGDVLVSGVITATTFIGNLTGTSTTAINLQGGAASQIAYQVSPGITSFIANGTPGYILQSNGSDVPSWFDPADGFNVSTANYALVAGIATYAGSAGIATYSYNAGIATYAGSAGIATYADNSGIATYAGSAGIATYSYNAGIATYAGSAGIATYAGSAGIATYSYNAGIATYAGSAGIATVATKLQNIRTFEITGDIVAPPQNFDGTANVSFASSIQPNTVGLGTHTYGDYVKNITGTTGEIEVSVTSGEGVSPQIGLPDNVTISDSLRVVNDVQIDRNLNVTGNITIGGTSAYLSVENLVVKDRDIIAGFVTDAYGNDASTDISANTGGIAIASTEGSPLVNLNVVGFETLPPTYKKIMWFKANTFAGLNTDAWMFNYGVGIGSTQIPNGVRLAVGGVQVTDSDIIKIRNINASGIITASTFVGNVSGIGSTAINLQGGAASQIAYQVSPGITSFIANGTPGWLLQSDGDNVPYWVNPALGFNVSNADYAIVAGIATYATSSGIATYAKTAGVSTSVIGGIGSLTQLQVTGISTFTNGPVFIGAATSTGTTSQPLQVTGGAYVSGNIGIGTTNPTSKLTISGALRSQALGIGSEFIVSDTGSFVPSVSIAATIGSGTTEKVLLRSISRNQGTLDVVSNYRQTQMMNVSDTNSEGVFRVTALETSTVAFVAPIYRQLLVVGESGIVTTRNAVAIATANATGASGTVGADIYGNVNIRSPFSTSTSYVAIAPNFRDNGALSFEAPIGAASTNSVTQLFSITNNVSSSIFRINDLNRNPILEANVAGNIGIGTTLPFVKLDVALTSQFRGRVAFAQTGNPNNNSAIDLIPASSGFSTTGFGTYVPSGGALVMTENRGNTSTKGAGNSSQIFTVENNNSSLFRVNTVGIGVSTVANPFSIYPILDITGSGDVRIFDTETRKILTNAPGFSSTTPGDGDLLRIDSYVTPFIGSFPTVRKALLMNKFGDMEFYRNIITNITLTKDLYVLNQGVGIGTTNIDSTKNVKLQVVGNARITSIGATALGQIDISHLSSSTLSPSGISTSGIYSGSPSRGSVIFSGIPETNLNGGQLVTITNDNASSIFTVNRFVPGVAGLSSANPTNTRTIETVVNVTSGGNVGIGTTNPLQRIQVGTGSSAITVNSLGSVGIGTTNPQAKLDVSADALISGLTIGKGTGSVSSNTALGYQALLVNTTGSYNTATGYRALYSNTTGTLNTANGYLALFSNTTGTKNTANGGGSLYSNTTGSNNTATGVQALNSNTTGTNNTANGYLALTANTTGINNTATGWRALNSNTTGNYNTATGYAALQSNTTGSNNTANGLSCLLSNTTGTKNTATGRTTLHFNTTGSSNTANGYQALYNNTTGINNTATGSSALFSNTIGLANSGFGFQALYSNTTGINNTATGHNSLYSNTIGSSNTANGYRALLFNTTGTYNTATGFQALYSNTTGTFNTANGYQALQSNTTGTKNTANGLQALYSNTTGTNNTATGYAALYFNTTGSNNTANGYRALVVNTTGNFNTANGYKALQANTTGSNNTATGYQALYSNITGIYNTATGYEALYFNTGNYNVANGYRALQSNTNGYFNTATGVHTLRFNTTGNNNTATGQGALYANISGGSNTATGYQALGSNTTGANNTANGIGALYANVGAINNTATGSGALNANTTGNYNTANGQGALNANTTGTSNTANGVNALRSNTTGVNNTANGHAALQLNTTGTLNTATGLQALYSNTIGGANTANGVYALYANTTGVRNTANGYRALQSSTTGNNNTANGYAALGSNTTGNNNTAIGYQAGNTITTGSNNSIIGYNAQPSSVSVSNEITLGDTNVDTLRVPGLGYYGVRTNTTVATTSATTIDSIVVATYRSARIQIQITQGSNYQVSDVLLIHDGTTASIIEYGTLATGSTLGTYSATISSGNALLQVNMGSATSSAVKVLSYRTVV